MMVRTALAMALLGSVSACTLILGAYDDSGVGGAATTASGTGGTTTTSTSTSSSGTGGTATATSSGTGGTTTTSTSSSGTTTSSTSSTSSSGTTTSTSSTSTTSTSSSGACNPATCPQTTTPCVEPACLGAPAMCQFVPSPLGQACSSGGGKVCSGTGNCVMCTGDSFCAGATPACNTSTGACVQCTASNHAACTSAGASKCSPTTNTCVACATYTDCPAGPPVNYCINGGCYVSGDQLSLTGQGVTVTLPACGADLVSLVSAACNLSFSGTYWCSNLDATGTGTYHTHVCAAPASYRFEGDLSCAGTTWTTDQGVSCSGGVVTYAPAVFGNVGQPRQFDCCLL